MTTEADLIKRITEATLACSKAIADNKLRLFEVPVLLAALINTYTKQSELTLEQACIHIVGLAIEQRNRAKCI